MNKLREKFEEELGLDCLSEKCEQITDDFSVKFAIFIKSEYKNKVSKGCYVSHSCRKITDKFHDRLKRLL